MIILDASKLISRQEAHQYLQDALSLPDYYGRNLDALYDCLTDLDETEVAFINTEESEDTYFDRILSVFEDAAEANSRLTILEDTPVDPAFQEAEDYLESDLFGDAAAEEN